MDLLRYSLLRLLLFLVTAGVLWLLGMRGFVLLLVAILVSGFVSIVALRRPRDAASGALDRRLRRINERIESSAAAEDASPAEDVAPAEDAAPARERDGQD